MRISAFLGEPLVQFLAIGTVLATLYALVPEEPAISDESIVEPILVSEGRIAQLESLFERTWRRPPTPTELDSLIDAFVREEVLYRAGRDLGLDEDDTVVRRRIAQKMGFLMEPAPGEIEPTIQDLERHLATFPERFTKPARASFEQVYLDPAKHDGRASAAVEEAVAALKAGADPAGIGDPTLMPARLKDEQPGNIAQIFGTDFADAVLEAPMGQWHGPLRSPYGIHLVRVATRMPARIPNLSEIRGAVTADWEAMRRKEVIEERFRTLKARYAVEVARRPDATATGAGEAVRRAEAGRQSGVVQ